MIVNNKNHIKEIFIILLISAIILYLSNILIDGRLNSIENLTIELRSAPTELLYDWKMSEIAPFKYRFLFPFIVKKTYQAFFSQPNVEGFYYVYLFYTYLSLCFAGVSFYFLSILVYDNTAFVILSMFLFFTSCPILFSHIVPVHTREDFLAYGLLCMGLIYIIKNYWIAYLLISILGVLCRETLLLLPFIYLFFSNNQFQKLPIKLILAAIPFVVYFLLRYILGTEHYDYWLGLKWNIKSLEQVVLFFFLTFHLLWFFFIFELFNHSKNNKENSSGGLLLHQSALSATGLVLTTTFLFAIFNEIRILFLIFPWVISLSSRWLINNKATVCSYFLNKKNTLYFVLISLLFILLVCAFLMNVKKLAQFVTYPVLLSTWIPIALFYIYLLGLSLPFIVKIIKNITKVKFT
ncbi:MAG: hypothetical protein EAZ07_00215 [Cytophagales bacterium]|nr:MAG: hypothetical protein EAZ07_00215 [Cytophagales bacterium]